MNPIFTAERLPENIVNKITGITYRPNPHITLSELSYLKITYVNFQGEDKVGEMICNSRLSKELLEIFRELYEIKYPIEKILLADEYGGDDDKIMGDNNSSCFNYRTVANTHTVSLHGLGRAVDINPLYNPYIVGGVVMPANATPYADRTKAFPHKIDENDPCCKIFKAHGWKWGGNWERSKDYQHFYKPDGRIKRLICRIKKVIK